MKLKKGFTLIELLIVLAVISALLATLIPVANSALERAKGVQVAFNLRSVMDSVVYYYLINDDIPPTLEEVCRNLKPEQYGAAFRNDNGRLTIIVFTNQTARARIVNELLPEVTTSSDTSDDLVFIKGGLQKDHFDNANFYYEVTYSF